MKLFIETEIQSGSVPVRWCVEREELEELKKRGVLDTYILLVVVPLEGMGRSYAESRYLVKLDQMMEFITFYRPGRHKIFGAIVWDGNESEMKKIFLSRSDKGVFKMELYDYWASFKSELDNFRSCLSRWWNRSIGLTEIEVMVPKEVFAKEPPKWEQKWVNMFFKEPAKNQCEYRKRRIFAYTVQPPFVILFGGVYVVAVCLFRFLVVLFLLLCGTRGINFRPIIHPIKMENRDIWWALRGSVFNPKWEDRIGRKHPFLVLLPFTPIVVFGIGLGTYLILDLYHSLSIAKLLLVMTIMISSAVGCLGLISLRNFILIKKEIAEIEKLGVSSEWDYEVVRKKKTLESRYREYEIIACNGNFTPKIDALPPKKRTIILRYKNLKGRVCKPFAI